MSKRQKRLYKNHLIFGLIGLVLLIVAFATYDSNFSGSITYAYFGVIAAVISLVYWEKI